MPRRQIDDTTRQSFVAMEKLDMHNHYLRLLSERFPNSESVLTEIINLQAILSLPKGTEHFVSDLHGASSAFMHMIKNASGVIRRKVDYIYEDTLTEQEKRALCALIYYPRERIQLVHQHGLTIEALPMPQPTIKDWYCRRILQTLDVMRSVSVKYSRSKVRRLLPKQFAYIIEELIYESSIGAKRTSYFQRIVDSIIAMEQAENLLVAISQLIHSLAIDSLHIVGDIFDRGPGAVKIMEELSLLRDYDIQWGNHDIAWMGAFAGNWAMIATVLRVSIRYANIETLEEGYGINLLPLANFAMETYGNDPCTVFQTKDFENNPRLTRSAQLMAKMHKAISIIQFKLEGQTIMRHPEYEMDDRLFLDKIDYTRGVITLDGKEYPITDTYLPTVYPNDPHALSQEEHELMEQLARSFRKSEKMQKHLRMLYQHGSLYLVRNGFLLYHAAIPLNEDGTLMEVNVCGERVKGKALMQRIDRVVRQAYYGSGQEQKDALDYMLYLWCGYGSPLYHKDKMSTFERYFIAVPELEHERKGAYYTLADSREVCEMILREFGLDPERGRIINGHIPVKTIKGETPMRAEGKRFVIDGGFSKPYQAKTGIAGYTLIYSSYGIQLVEHEKFESREQAALSGSDIHSRIQLQKFSNQRILIRDTDRGQALTQQIKDLQHLLQAYQMGLIEERQG